MNSNNTLRDYARHFLNDIDLFLGEFGNRRLALETAVEWRDAGFGDLDDITEWAEAGVYKAAVAAELRDAGLTPSDVATPQYNGEPLGYQITVGDVSVESVLDLRNQRADHADA